MTCRLSFVPVRRCGVGLRHLTSPHTPSLKDLLSSLQDAPVFESAVQDLFRYRLSSSVGDNLKRLYLRTLLRFQRSPDHVNYKTRKRIVTSNYHTMEINTYMPYATKKKHHLSHCKDPRKPVKNENHNSKESFNRITTTSESYYTNIPFGWRTII